MHAQTWASYSAVYRFGSLSPADTVESRYIELGYFEVSLISNRCQRPGGWQWL